MIKDSVLILPRRMCGACGSDRFWRDFTGEDHCWDCAPPPVVIKRLKDAKAKRIAERRKTDFDVERAIEDEGRRGAVIPKHW